MDSATWSDAQALAYIASYRDLRSALGADAEAGRRHYATAGAAEGRGITFDPLRYVASYADLRRAFGADPEAATRHYILIGAAEGRELTFDPLSYIASYADLRTAFGTDAAAATRHFVLWGANEGRAPSFDAWAYLASYADLRSAFGSDTAAATRHFIRFGANEGRTVSFDSLGYIASYADLRAALGTDTVSATRHFVQWGAAEGRTITFDALAYVASYADLRSAFGTDASAATRHYIQWGAAEGRNVTFDALAYVASYADLRTAFGTDASAATRHYIQWGAAEGRSVTFDAVAYLLSNSDLAAAGLNAKAALRHWINFGATEGRSASGSFGVEQASHLISASGSVTSTIDAPRDRDWYKIELDGGQGVTFRLLSATGDGQISLYDATGQTVPATAAGDLRTSFLAPRSGTYYLVVAAGNDAIGSYTLTRDSSYFITGTTRDDTLAGTEGADAIRGLDGNDILNGRGGNDVLEGGAGFDRLDGGLGADILYGNNANNSGLDWTADQLSDTLGGDDQLYGQDGDDFLQVTRQASAAIQAASTVVLDGGAGNDSIIFGANGRFLDTVTIRGDAGSDDIRADSAATATIDAGDGDDKVTIGAIGGDQTVTLGAGSDTLSLQSASGGFAVGNAARVTDFLVGSDRLVFDDYLIGALTGWTRGTNPFASGHLRLVQSGSDTLVQIDRDGSAGTSYGLATLLTLSNVTATNLTARELGYTPDGSAGAPQTLVGTAGNDTLTGADGADTIRGLDGNDTLSGRSGNDLLEGGLGYDRLYGGLGDDILYGNNATNSGSFDGTGDSLSDSDGGNDQLFGQDGNDDLLISRYDFSSGSLSPSTVLLDGGAGNDTLRFSSSRSLDTVTVKGGTGKDDISVSYAAKATIDAGDDNDKVSIVMTGADQTVTLGNGADILTLDRVFNAVTVGSPTRVTDFRPGTDILFFDGYLSDILVGWDKAANPFGTGHLRLVQSGADTLLQVDRDGSTGMDHGFVTLLTLSNTIVASFSDSDLGYQSDGSASPGRTVTGTNDGDTLLGTGGADIIRGLDGSDILTGRAGNDVLEGGAGYDQLDGGFGDDTLYGNNAGNTGWDSSSDMLSDNQGGNDRLFGQDGDDAIYVSRYAVAASTLVLDGGIGNDSINFSSFGRAIDTVTVAGGAGNDTITIGNTLRSTIDAGEGDDKVTIAIAGGNQTITLGAGADSLSLDAVLATFVPGGTTRVTDFRSGTDTLVMDQFLATILSDWDKASNPFATGHLKLMQSGTDAVLQLDRDGSAGTAYASDSLLTFANTSAASLTARDLGFAPIVASSLADHPLPLTPGVDVPFGVWDYMPLL